MQKTASRGLLYRCPVCGSEVTVVAYEMARFAPQCCNRDMVRMKRRVAFYVCPVCGAEVAVIHPTHGRFSPHCCNKSMLLQAAA
jgi:endogenous inhibitor of DNA gyrase (YacG/DUF329 family)